MTTDAQLSRQRRFVTPLPGDDWSTIAGRVLPDEPTEAAIGTLQMWNLHLFARRPPGSFTGSDVIFVEEPLADGPAFFGDAGGGEPVSDAEPGDE